MLFWKRIPAGAAALVTNDCPRFLFAPRNDIFFPGISLPAQLLSASVAKHLMLPLKCLMASRANRVDCRTICAVVSAALYDIQRNAKHQFLLHHRSGKEIFCQKRKPDTEPFQRGKKRGKRSTCDVAKISGVSFAMLRDSRVPPFMRMAALPKCNG